MKEFGDEYFYGKVGKINDWDFYKEVINRCKKTDILLDIGTGDSEIILRIASSLFCLIGIDLSSGILETAVSNLKNSNTLNVKFLQMSSYDLHFDFSFFDVVFDTTSN